MGLEKTAGTAKGAANFPLDDVARPGISSLGMAGWAGALGIATCGTVGAGGACTGGAATTCTAPSACECPCPARSWNRRTPSVFGWLCTASPTHPGGAQFGAGTSDTTSPASPTAVFPALPTFFPCTRRTSGRPAYVRFSPPAPPSTRVMLTAGSAGSFARHSCRGLYVSVPGHSPDVGAALHAGLPGVALKQFCRGLHATDFGRCADVPKSWQAASCEAKAPEAVDNPPRTTATAATYRIALSPTSSAAAEWPWPLGMAHWARSARPRKSKVPR